MSQIFNPGDSEKPSTLKLKSVNLAFGAQIFSALGDVSRLRILNLLYHRQELSISDMEVILEFTQTKVARLMAILKNAGLVQSRREYHWVLYQIKEEALDFVGDNLEFIQKDPILLKDLAWCDHMRSNRELSIVKLENKGYKGLPNKI